MYWLHYSFHISHHPSQTPCLPWISYAIQKLMSDSCKMLQNSLKHSIRLCGIFPSLKQYFIAYCSSKVSWRPDCIFEINQLWKSGFNRVYSNCCCSCSFEPETINISHSSYTLYSNNILNCQKSTTILDACINKVWKLFECPTYVRCAFYGGVRPYKKGALDMILNC